jgi:RNase P protein component
MLTDIPAGWDIVISVRNQALGTDLHTLSRDIALLLRKAQLVSSAQKAEE